MNTVKVGIVGCGAISGIYFKNLCQTFSAVEVVSCSELIPERMYSKSKEFGVGKAYTTEELLADPEVEIVLNITTPIDHAAINIAALEAGKNIHCEKPLAVNREDGKKTVDLAKSKGLLLGGAPDTFLGGGYQTCRKLIDDGWIGTPTGATAFMVCGGHESWHPDPEFYYEVGGGPMFDMGPYYLTALVSLLGPVKRVTGMTRVTFPERTITSPGKYGKKIRVEVPTHVAGIMEFEQGAIGTILTSFDVMGGSTLPRIEVYGSEGTLICPDPNTFGGPVLYQKKGGDGFKEVPLTFGFTENSRGIGLADMAYALRTGRKNRTNGDLTYHILDIMCGFHDSANTGRHWDIESTCERPAPLPMGLGKSELE